MKTKQRLHINLTHGLKTATTVFLLLLSACSGQDTPAIDQGEKEPLKLSDQELRIEIDGWKPLEESRANLYEDSDDFYDDGTLDAPKPGGNFTLYGYINKENNNYHTYLGGARAYWSVYDNVGKWIFLSSENEEITYYWPQNDAVNFFAYMPYNGYTGLSHPVKNFQYSTNDGQTFECELPATNANDANEIEFIYAYEEGVRKPAIGEALSLEFKHPFAVVYFKLSPESSRLTIHSLSLQDVYLKGKFSARTSTWASIDEVAPSTFTATINKRIPNDINYDTEFAGPFLVMPQTLSNQVKLVLDASRDGTNRITPQPQASLTGSWEPGKKYIYTLETGDRNEEIYFTVNVEDWIVVEHTNEKDVE